MEEILFCIYVIVMFFKGFSFFSIVVLLKNNQGNETKHQQQQQKKQCSGDDHPISNKWAPINSAYASGTLQLFLILIISEVTNPVNT